MMMKNYALFIVTAMYLLDVASGHAVYLTYQSYCANQELITGQTIMVATSISGSNTISVKRNGRTLTSGANYNGGETLAVTMNGFTMDLSTETVLEARGTSHIITIAISSINIKISRRK